MDANVKTYCTALKQLVGNDDPLVILARTPSRIRSLITGIDAAVLRQRPRPTKWSVAEIITHLSDSELVFGYRLRMIVAADGSKLQAFDPDGWASNLSYGTSDVRVAVDVFAALRLGNLHMLSRVKAPLLDNSGIHEEWGTETARSIILLEAGHDLNHTAQIEKILEGAGTKASFVPSTKKSEVPTEAAEKVDLRIGTIVDIVPIPQADRLMKLTVDFGSDRRSVIAGIRSERTDPRVLVGRQALFYYNLPKKTIRGHVSEAMLCDLGYADGIAPALLVPEWPVPDGTRAG